MGFSWGRILDLDLDLGLGLGYLAYREDRPRVCALLNKSTHLYKWVSPFVGQSVRWLVCWSVKSFK